MADNLMGFSTFLTSYASGVTLADRSYAATARQYRYSQYGSWSARNKDWFVPTALIVVVVFAVLGMWWKGRILRRNIAKYGRPSRSRTNELGSGDLAKKEHIIPWTTPHDEYDTVLPVKELRGSEGVVLKEGNLVIPREERNRHVLIIAKTGSGKTTKMILPVLYSDCLNANRSTIVLDSKPEMWEKLAGLTRMHNPEKKILLFNPLDLTRSMSWNILGKIESDTDAKLIANTIIMATDNPNSKSDSPFFRNNALQVLNAMMCGLLADPAETLSMPRVHELAHSGMLSLCDWLEAHPVAIRNTKTFVELARSGSQNADTIMSELGMRLSAWDLHAVRATTAANELDVEHLIHEPTLLIVELRESELEMLRPMANVIVVELLRFLVKRAEQCPKQTLPRPVSLVIDEFASALGRLPDIHVKLNTMRSRNVSIVAAIQSIAQIRANYDKDADSVLSGFSTKVFMPALDFQDAEWASKETGTMTVRFNVASQGKNKRKIDYFSHNNDNLQEQVQQRAVLTPDEIGRPTDNRCTFFMPNTPVFQGHLIAYYKVPSMLKDFNDGEQLNFLPRDKPLEYEEVLPEPVQHTDQGGGSNSIFDLTPEQLKEALENVKPLIGWVDCDPIAKEWWLTFEQANATNLASVLNLGHELRKRGVTISEFYAIYASSGLQDVPALLNAIDQHVYNEFKRKLEWDNTSDMAKEWWVAFEEANKENFPVVVELARELLRRGVTIEDFFNVYVHSDYETIPEILSVIDYLLQQGKIGKEAKSESQDSTDEEQQDLSIVSNEADDLVEDRPEQSIDEIEKPQKKETTTNKTTGQAAISGPIAKSVEAQDVGNGGNGGARKKSQALPALSKEQKTKAAVQGVHVNSYFAMAEELLKQGKYRDFDVLIKMASEDTRLTENDITELKAIRKYYEEHASK